MLAVIAALTVPALAADPLVDLRRVVPGAVFDLRYASVNNFIGKALYPFDGAYLRRSTAEKLAKVEKALEKKGFRLLIYDAYRPLSAQKELWKAKPDRRFVADPATGSTHNRGGAVDAGLAGRDGKALDMPSAFDAFVPEAAHGAPGVPAERRARAEALKAAMTAAGFVALPEEWWHYEDSAARAWPLLDVPFEELRK